MVGFPIHPQATLPPMQIDQHNEYYSGNLQHIDSHNSFINLLHGTPEFMNVSMYVRYLEVIVSSTWFICGLRRINDLTRISRLINNNHLTRYTIQSAAHTKQKKKTKMQKKIPDPQQMKLHMMLLLLLQMSQLVHHFFCLCCCKDATDFEKSFPKKIYTNTILRSTTTPPPPPHHHHHLLYQNKANQNLLKIKPEAKTKGNKSIWIQATP
jgi:hypothetical protein